MIPIREERIIAEMCSSWRKSGLRTGFVPTMGALHPGHLALVQRALELSDRVVVSIFVNPSQFGRGEDLASYPRTLREDCLALEDLGVSAVFAPEADTVYPPGFSSMVHVNHLTEGLCGAARPGHFDGVATVCAVLFGILKPHLAVFGRKDAQQLAMIRRMVRDLRLGVEIEAVPVVREPDGLAMSSRNAYLSKEEREQAPALYRGLLEAKALAEKGETRCSELKDMFREVVDTMPLLRTQYVETVDPCTMQPVHRVEGQILLAAAVHAGKTRLIDNVLIEPEV